MKGKTHKDESINKMRLNSTKYTYEISGEASLLAADIAKRFDIAETTVARRCISIKFPSWVRSKI